MYHPLHTVAIRNIPKDRFIKWNMRENHLSFHDVFLVDFILSFHSGFLCFFVLISPFFNLSCFDCSSLCKFLLMEVKEGP
jgi:hypothetical protein